MRSIGGDSVPDVGDASYVARVGSLVAPDKNGSAAEFGEPETNDGAVLNDPVEIVTGAVPWRPERAETALTVDVPLPARAPSVLDVCGATTGFECLGGAVVVGKIPCGHGGCDVLRPHGIAVSNNKVLEGLDSTAGHD